jgi:hypothetical protein
MPQSSISPTGASPLRRLKLLVGQCATPAPRAAISASSSAPRCTACASTVPRRRSPAPSYTPAYDGASGYSSRVNVTSCGFSEMCVWMRSARSFAASAPRDESRSGVVEIAKRGVRIGCTSDRCASYWPGPASSLTCVMSLCVSARDCSAEDSM